MPRATIKEIARLAGVSVTTVSRALNDAPEISPETRERVLRICREQDYRINALARSLVSSRTGVLGVVLPDLSGPFHAALSLHLERYARDRGYQIMLCCGRPGDDRIDSLFDLLVRHRVDGILLVSASDAAQELLRSRARDRRRALASRAEEPLEDHAHLTAGDETERSAVRDGLRRALGELSREERRLFTLRFVYGLPSAEIGGVLGLSPNGVDARVSRLRKKLKRLLARQGLGLWEQEGDA